MNKLLVRDLADEVIDAGVVVIGTGVAGLSAALSLSPMPVTVVTKTKFGAGGSSPWAQGGIAAAMASGDSPSLHAQDTLDAGAGLCDPEAVEVLTEEGPRRVRRLIALGANFDRGEEGRLLMGREGAHGRRRILHAGGDQTGAEMVRALKTAVAADPAIAIHEHTFAMDLVRVDDRVVGVLCRSRGRRIFYRASAVILAAGGFGQLYSKTTNPVENTGDGLAMAARAGAQLADLEMVQFHPTALDVEAPGGTLPLVTEALRGEGAVLIDEAGFRFMPEIHPAAELAPRDVVARAIWQRQSGGKRVFLDARESVGPAFPQRFPTVYDHCRRYGIDPCREPIPVTPAAHYVMAGVVSDENGRASLDGLWVCGEVSATGVHGANRLASNSLLEGLVFGHRAALDVVRHVDRGRGGLRFPGGRADFGFDLDFSFDKAFVLRDEMTLAVDRQADLRALMWNKVGLIRDGKGLKAAFETLGEWADTQTDPNETANLWTVARMVTAAALIREESRGSHYRTDFPEPDPVWKRRLLWTYRTSGELPLQRVMDPFAPASSFADRLMREIA